MFLDIIKPFDKLPVRHLQRIIRVQFIQSRSIDDGEEEISQLLRRTLLVILVQFSLQFVQFLTHLLPHILTFLPVEAHVPGLVLNSVRLDDTGQRSRHPRQHPFIPVLLLQLDLLPVLQHLCDGGDLFPVGNRGKIVGHVWQRLGVLGINLRRMIHMRMPGDHLLRQGVTHVRHVKLFLFLCDLRIETDVQQHVTQLLADVVDIVLDQGVAELVGLFDRIGSQTLVRLFLVPRTVRPQRVEHVQETTESLHFFLFCMHNTLIIGAKIQNN